MELLLKNLTLENFKGHKKMSLDFDTHETNIYGANGSGKTTIVDAYNWLLFDKDSTGRKDFEIKTLDKNGNTKKDLEHSVEGVFIIDGEELTLKKIYKEKWTRKKGFATDEFTGNVTTYYWNNVPVKKDEYNSKINSLIQDDEIFRILSDVKYFNSLTWQRRREILFSVVNLEKVKDEFETKYLTKGKTVEELRREIAASKKKLLSDIDQCPVRIDEVSKSIQEEPVDDVTDDDAIQAELTDIDNQLSSRTAANEGYTAKVTKANDKKNELIAKRSKIKDDILKKHRSALDKIDEEIEANETRIRKLKRDIDNWKSEIDPLERQLGIYNVRLAGLRTDYVKISEENFPTNELSCPTCGVEFNEDKRQTLINKFNEGKSNRLDSLTNDAGIVKGQIQTKQNEIDLLKKQIDDGEHSLTVLGMQHTQLTEKKSTAKDNANSGYLADLAHSEYDAIGLEIEAIDKSLSTTTIGDEVVDNTSLIERRKVLTDELNRNRRIREIIAHNEKQQRRIEEIEQERLVLLDKLSANEKVEFELSEYIKRQVDSVETSLSSIFKGVSFKMFDTQINQGLTPTCVVLRDGVPYSDLNTASKVWISLEIIEVLSKIYKIKTPVFIDNRESTIEIPDVDSQIINLYVSKSDKKLKIK